MLAIFMHFVVAVRAGGFAGAAYPTDDLPSFDLFANLHFYLEHMAIKGFVAISMIDDYVVAIAGA